jgi:hypothetical protein
MAALINATFMERHRFSEVGGEVGAGEVVVRDPAVALDAPLGLPGVPDE